MKLLEMIDYKLLKKQKKQLLKLIWNEGLDAKELIAKPKVQEALMGILHLIDHIEDQQLEVWKAFKEEVRLSDYFATWQIRNIKTGLLSKWIYSAQQPIPSLPYPEVVITRELPETQGIEIVKRVNKGERTLKEIVYEHWYNEKYLK